MVMKPVLHLKNFVAFLKEVDFFRFITLFHQNALREVPKS